LALPLAFWPA